MQETKEVFHVSRYSFTNSETGELVRGSKVSFCDSRDNDDDNRGFKIITMNAPYEAFDVIQNIPGKYLFTYRKKTYQNKQFISLSSVEPSDGAN